MTFIWPRICAFIAIFTMVFFVAAIFEKKRAEKYKSELSVAIENSNAAAAAYNQCVASRQKEIERVQARQKTLTQKEIDDVKNLSAAPRDTDGNIICDAACLRARFKK